MKPFRAFFLILLFMTMPGIVYPVQAQNSDAEYRLNLRRNIGFSNGSQIKGDFTFSILGDEAAIQSVTYLVDDKPLATVTEAPFTYRFHTEDLPLGSHALSAQVQTTDGRTVTTPVRQFEFVDSETEFATVQKIIVPIFGITLLITLIGIGVQFFFVKNKTNTLPPGAPRSYGWKGGTVCQRCGRPYSLHIWGINLAVGSLDRCDYCGKWALVRRASPTALRMAELAELQNDGTATVAVPKDSDEDLRRQLDESRYSDLK